MQANQQYGSAVWGYVLTVFLFIMLTSALAFPRVPISMAQEPAATPGRSEPGPERPQPGPPRSTPPPPTAPPAPTPPAPAPPAPAPAGEPESPAESTPEATATAVPLMMPRTGGAVGAGVTLLLAGLAFTVAGVSVNVIHHRRSRQQGRLQQADGSLRDAG
jgi:hypothetical protein